MKFQHKLIDWFRAHQRPLPWRKHYRPYEVWVSEIMLQQTRMDSVLPYFERWMKRFPTVRALAQADERDVLKAWEGLGYYSRARNLHAGARRVVAEFGGEVPRDLETIRSLKGIGPYTAGAIASIAFNQDRPIVDGNVVRVLSRLYASKQAFDTAEGQEFFWGLAERLIPPGQAREFNQAMMELGALLCSPAAPSCGICPLKACCKAAAGDPEAYPARRKRQKTVKVRAAALVLKKSGRFFLRKRPLGSIMGGLWEFPEWKLASGKALTEKNALALAQKAAESELGGLPRLEPIGTIQRHYTRYAETLDVYEAEYPGDGEPASPRGWSCVWAGKKDFKKYPFSSAHAKIAAMAAKA